MDIIVAGAGGVGFRLAKVLSFKHNVTVIDKNEEALNRLQNSIDVMIIHGNIEDPITYTLLTDKKFDLFIAVTDSDEINIISTLIADEFIVVKSKIIRLRNTFFADSSISEKLNISFAVFPFDLTAKTLESLLFFPYANNVKSFIEVNQKLISIRIYETLNPRSLSWDSLKIVGIERDKSFYFLKENDSFMKDDLVYIFGQDKEIKKLCSKLKLDMPTKVKNIVIFGADTLGIEIALSLSKHDTLIKLVESDLYKCKQAVDVLQDKVTIINSKYEGHALFVEEGISEADMVIASSTNDEENIIKCLEAKEYGVEKVIAINNDMELYYLMHKLGIVAVRGPKTNAYYSIVEQIASTTLVHKRQYCGGKASVLFRHINKDSELLEKKVRPFKGEEFLLYLIRGDSIEVFDEVRILEEDDVIVLFGTLKYKEEHKFWINHL